MSVEAANDIQASAVLDDLMDSMPDASEIRTSDEGPIHPLLAAFVAVVIWFALLMFALVGVFFAHQAGFIDIHSTRNVWSDAVPVMGGHRILYGLFRLWVALIPVVAVAVAARAWWEARHWVGR